MRLASAILTSVDVFPSVNIKILHLDRIESELIDTSYSQMSPNLSVLPVSHSLH
jgi:hypothetical protein